MIKNLKTSDITVRPFKTFKKWSFQNIEEEVSVQKEEDLANLDFYVSSSLPYLLYDPRFPVSGKVKGLDTVEDPFKISEGEKVVGTFRESSSFFFTGSENPQNSDGTYKRLIYNSVKNNFYEHSNPDYRFGIETIDFDKGGRRKEQRHIQDQIRIGQVRSEIFGESIHPGSVTMVDLSNPDERYTLEDDGYTNLKLTDKYFKDEIHLSQNLEDPHIEIFPTNSYNPMVERFGESLDSAGDYVVVGSPDDADSLTHPKAGHVELIKYDVSESRFRPIKTLYSPNSQNAVALQINTADEWMIELEQGGYLLTGNQPANYTSMNDRFGQDVSMTQQFMAIGAPNVECHSGSLGGVVFVQDKFKGGVDNWGTINVLESGIYDDQFGYAVKVDGDILAIGAPGHADGAGAVYIYHRKEYNNVNDPCINEPTSSFYQVLTPEDNFFFPLTQSWCGNEFILEGDSGSLFSEGDTPTFVSGTNTYVLKQRIVPLDSTTGERFGGSIDMKGDTLVIGNSKYEGTGPGSVYVYKFDASEVVISGSTCTTGSWIPACKMDKDFRVTESLYLPGFASVDDNDSYGYDVSVEGAYIVVGAPTYGRIDFLGQNYNFGAAFVYEKGLAYEEEFHCNNCCDLDTLATASCDYVFTDRFVSLGDKLENNWYGTAVDISENRFIVGSPTIKKFVTASYSPVSSSYEIEEFGVERDHGKFFVYNLDADLNWQLEKEFTKRKLLNNSKQQFGHSIKMTEQYIFAGSPSHVYEDGITSVTYSSSYFDLDQLKAEMPNGVSGSVYVYDVDDLNGFFQVGNVFYKNGLVVLTDTGSFFGNIMSGTGSRGHSIDFKGEHTIYENEYMISAEPGEFNISTNPTSLVKDPVILDINGDGVFDFDDVDLILRYISKFKFLSEDQIIQDSSVVLETTEDWWNSAIIMTEAEDALVLDGPNVDVLQEEFEADGGKLDADLYNKLVELDDAGYLDFDKDGKTNQFDSNILLKYWANIRNEALIEGNINDNSQLNTPALVSENLDNLTGKFNLQNIRPEFHNYLESSSLDKSGSYLSPYITTVGLYNENYEMVAVAKLAKPTKVLQDTPLNIAVRIDV